MEQHSYLVTAEHREDRLDIFIALKCGLTRSHVQKLISTQLVTVNSRPEKAGYRIKPGDRIVITIPDAADEGVLIPEDVPLDILWEDSHIIAVNKPPGVVIYPAAGNRSGTLMNAVASHCPRLASIGAPLRPGVVHRLDKDTSGVIVIAKNDQAYYRLVDQFKYREVEKHYLALLFGNLKEDQGEIAIPIGRSVSDRKKMSTRSRRGKEAITRYEVQARYGPATLAKIRIITGRTHQIRVHFAAQGHPVLGDRTYGRKTVIRHGNPILQFPRQMLHAWRLKLTHPSTGEGLLLEAPLPGDMASAIDMLRMIA